MFRSPRSYIRTGATRDRGLTSPTLIGALLMCIANVSHAGEPNPSTAVAAAPSGAQLLSANGVVLGTINGRTTSYDADANLVGAYGVVSARGYFADVLPSGTLGQVLSLVYASPACSGAAAIEQSSVVGGPLPVPAYVFAFNAPAQLWNVPARANLREMTVGSVRQRSREGYECVAAHRRARVYPLQSNRSDVSGFAAHYDGPLEVRVLSARVIGGDGMPGSEARRAPPRETGAGADLAPDTAACAPGCFLPYLGDHICEAECANSLCGFDAGDCSAAYVERAKQHEASLCAPSCTAGSVGDGFCDGPCNVSSCEFDRGDCKTP